MATMQILTFAMLTAVYGRTLKFGMDTDFPPYAYRNSTTGELAGFGKDIADGMTALCDDVTIEVVYTNWANCIGGGSLGVLIENGTLDACMTYTHAHGFRDQVADFSYAILNDNKPAGLMTLLVNGVPKVNGNSNLDGVKVSCRSEAMFLFLTCFLFSVMALLKVTEVCHGPFAEVVDVGGWAPPEDTLSLVTNKCTDEKYSTNLNLQVAMGGYDEAMTILRNGSADAMYVYADMAEKAQCTPGVAQDWNCTLWTGFGTEYAYVQTGQYGYMVNGTTLALTKKGSGVPELINSCLQRFMDTKDYYDLCVKYDFVSTCFPNSHFPTSTVVPQSYELATKQLTTTCADGYCPCPEMNTMSHASAWAFGTLSLLPFLM